MPVHRSHADVIWESSKVYGRTMRALLSPLGWLYGGATALRNRAFDVGLLLLICRIFGSGNLRIGKMVGIAELQPVAPVAAEEPQAGIQGVQFVEVEAREEDSVLEMVCAWLKSMVHHSGLIEAGATRSIIGGGTVGHAQSPSLAPTRSMSRR